MTPSELARTFLEAMERRDLAAAQGFLADGFTMLFPGGGGARVRAGKLADQKVWNDMGERLRAFNQVQDVA